MLRKHGNRRKRNGHDEQEELNLLPLMSLFVALVPTLLYSAVFVPVSAIGLDFPGTGGSASASPLALTVRLTETTIGLEGVPERAYPVRDRSSEETNTAALDSLRVELDEVHGAYPTSRGAILVVSRNVSYRDIVRVMDQVREAGFGNSTLLGAASAPIAVPTDASSEAEGVR
ncbi:MAG: ExbD/TolR family protein [Candidatus Eiseniibacteriota bacterium]